MASRLQTIIVISWIYVIHLTLSAHIQQPLKRRMSDALHNGVVESNDSHFDHEAIIGNKKEAEQFEHLPLEESKRRLSLLVKKMDTDGDSSVSGLELFEWIMKSLRNLADEEAEDNFSDADENENGSISWEEYFKDTFGPFDDYDHDDDSKPDARMVSSDKRLFKRADSNNDGTLSLDEFKKLSHPEQYSEMHDLLIDNLLAERDRDGDGLISFREYSIGTEDQAELISEQDKFKREYDKNGSGFLEREEILKWLGNNPRDIAHEEMIHLFAYADDNHDSVLSMEEILDHHEVFVGSEATDFGEHLDNIHRFTDEL